MVGEVEGVDLMSVLVAGRGVRERGGRTHDDIYYEDDIRLHSLPEPTHPHDDDDVVRCFIDRHTSIVRLPWHGSRFSRVGAALL